MKTGRPPAWRLSNVPKPRAPCLVPAARRSILAIVVVVVVVVAAADATVGVEASAAWPNRRLTASLAGSRSAGSSIHRVHPYPRPQRILR